MRGPAAIRRARPHCPHPRQEIDRLLSGGGLERQPSEPWGFAPAGSSGAGPGFNAFAEGGEPGASFPALASPAPGSAASTLKFGARAGSGDWAAARDAASPTAGEADGGGGGARVIGTGTVLHTFVGDYAQPEELSVFEGDQVGGPWVLPAMCGRVLWVVGSQPCSRS